MRLLDTWAWVEYFEGTVAGAAVRPMVEKGDAATCILTIAEMSDLHARAERPGLEEKLLFIAARGPIYNISHEAASRAGRTKWAQRRKGIPLGLGDAIIYEVAREHGLEVVTGDPGFRGLEGVRFIEAA